MSDNRKKPDLRLNSLADAEISPGIFGRLGPSTIGVGTSSINNSFGFAAVP